MLCLEWPQMMTEKSNVVFICIRKDKVIVGQYFLAILVVHNVWKSLLIV